MVSSRPDALAGFEEFYRSNYRKLVVMVMAVGASVDDAQDAVDAVMEEIIAKQRWAALEHPFPWIRRAAMRTYYDQCKRDRRGIALALKGGHQEREEYCDTGLNVWEDTQWVGQMIHALPPTQREVILAVLVDFTRAEIAEMFGKTVAAVRQNLLLARRRLQVLLNPDYQVGQTREGEMTGKEGGR